MGKKAKLTKDFYIIYVFNKRKKGITDCKKSVMPF